MAEVILKNTPIAVVVSISAAGAETIDLDDLASGIQVPSSPTVHIANIWWAIPEQDESATIVRNSVPLWLLSRNGILNPFGWLDIREEASDIVVTIPAGGGTVVLELRKTGGYSDAQHRNDAGWEPATTTTEPATTTTEPATTTTL